MHLNVTHFKDFARFLESASLEELRERKRNLVEVIPDIEHNKDALKQAEFSIKLIEAELLARAEVLLVEELYSESES